MASTPPRAVKTYGRRGKTRLVHGKSVASNAEKLWRRMLQESPQVKQAKAQAVPAASPVPYPLSSNCQPPLGESSHSRSGDQSTLNSLDQLSGEPGSSAQGLRNDTSSVMGVPRPASPALTLSPLTVASPSDAEWDAEGDVNRSFLLAADQAVDNQSLGDPLDLSDAMDGRSLLPDDSLTDPNLEFVGSSFASSHSTRQAVDAMEKALVSQLSQLDLASPVLDPLIAHGSWAASDDDSGCSLFDADDSQLGSPKAAAAIKPAEPTGLLPLEHYIPRRTVRRDHMMALCEQCDPLPLYGILGNDFATRGRKLGESTFSEVFLGPCRLSPAQTLAETVIKIIPFGGGNRYRVNCQRQAAFRDVYQEMCVGRLLSDWPQYRPQLTTDQIELTWNFIQVHRVAICQGTYPQVLLNHWDAWKLGPFNVCENDRPDFFPDNQLYAVQALAHAGTTVANFEFQSLAQVQSLLGQLIHTLAIAEHELKFEHRDLHWDNVMLAPTSRTMATYIVYDEPGSTYRTVNVPTAGLHVNIIDYTFSRLETDPSHVFYVDIKDKDMFAGTGDRQFDVYRDMQTANGGDWRTFNPRSNAMWLAYLVDKLLTAKPCATFAMTDVLHPNYRHDGDRLCAELAQCPSMVHLAQSSVLASYFVLPLETHWVA
ncbi:hypothetical protein H4R35_000372 [Dimargaris xerosporica]|nr:hypothetical protein H4R35_000372 [Dimargaris xerosporica]